MNERRNHFRTACRVTACIEEPGLIQADQYCRTSNIGMKGVFIPKAPQYPIGTKCRISIEDHTGKPLKLDAIVSHYNLAGVGFTFPQPPMDDCLRLKHIVKPVWDGKDFLEGMLLMLRYSEPATDLSECLALTSFLARNSNLFANRPHTIDNCPLH